MDVIISDVALAAAFGGLYLLSQQIGFAGLVKYYFIPYLYVNHWLVMVSTLLLISSTLTDLKILLLDYLLTTH